MAKRLRRHKKISRVMWSCAAFFALGFFPTRILGDPRVSLVAAACAIIPFGMRSSSIRQGMLRGLGLGLIAGVAIVTAVFDTAKLQSTPQQDLIRFGWFYVIVTTTLCMGVAALFAALAKRRERLIEDEWE